MQENNISPAQVWGLRHDITPSLGARLVQEGCRLHYLADRSNIQGAFTTEQAVSLERQFPLFIEYLESLLRIGELKPARQHQVSVSFGGFTCDADTRASCGYVYVTIYPTK
ncbi:type IV toxin-antitoxin system YeeU family antitoxin [Lelliottia wanjuensis]|uniref:type IV toxin-antitoxin system YeeU family antitoxin n=1 Tax=Lelliottia wanjuensis TaxID=3050585 RepID=UPI002551975A|nr:type IV toxin-antitoxin system YeeU family antitoxin [Lelliottia sp. V86_10]MDK9585750.1 type IV toxin-antitoxin system YeeU family antitoxin [Lelliottia sp. V86_10]